MPFDVRPRNVKLNLSNIVIGTAGGGQQKAKAEKRRMKIVFWYQTVATHSDSSAFT